MESWACVHKQLTYPLKEIRNSKACFQLMISEFSAGACFNKAIIAKHINQPTSANLVQLVHNSSK